MWLVIWCEPRRREQELSHLPPRLTTQHHPNMGTMEEQRKKRILGGELEPFWMKGYLMTLCLLIGGPCPCPHPMELPLIPPDEINPQSSTPSADINEAWYCMVLHDIAWHCMVLLVIALFWRFVWCCKVLHGIAWYCVVLHGTTQYFMVL